MKRPEQPGFAPANKLEAILMEAATDASKRPDFYRVLLESGLIVIGSTNSERKGSFVAGDDTTISVRQWRSADGTLAIPVFSSLPRLTKVLDHEETYVQLNARVLFGMIGTDVPVVLNPGSEFGKEFTPDEIAALLDGSLLEPAREVVEPGDRQVLLGQPADYPYMLVDVLRSLFARERAVESAYLAQIFNPATEHPPHPIIGVRLAVESADFGPIVQKAGVVARNAVKPGEIIDFIQVKEGEPVSEYMVGSSKPFYVRPSARDEGRKA